MELLDKTTAGAAFSPEDKRLVQSAAGLGTDLLRQALAQRQTQQLLLDAVGAALGASQQMAETLHGTPGQRLEQPPPAQVLEQLRQGLSADSGNRAGAEQTLRLAEAIRVLALKHGSLALDHCLHLVEQVRVLLDQVLTPR
jgi:two-component system nitrogen regulation response regulator NtrX